MFNDDFDCMETKSVWQKNKIVIISSIFIILIITSIFFNYTGAMIEEKFKKTVPILKFNTLIDGYPIEIKSGGMIYKRGFFSSSVTTTWTVNDLFSVHLWHKINHKITGYSIDTLIHPETKAYKKLKKIIITSQNKSGDGEKNLVSSSRYAVTEPFDARFFSSYLVEKSILSVVIGNINTGANIIDGFYFTYSNNEGKENILLKMNEFKHTDSDGVIKFADKNVNIEFDVVNLEKNILGSILDNGSLSFQFNERNSRKSMFGMIGIETELSKEETVVPFQIVFSED